jgi:hypothetical protein
VVTVPVAAPSLTLTVTPPGGTATDYSAYLAWSGTSQQMQITQNFGRQGDTALLALRDDWQGLPHPRFHIPVLSQVKLYDNVAAKTLFAGVINDPVQVVVGASCNDWKLQCTDYTYYADNSTVHGNFYGKTVDQIVVSLTQQANCGITAATIANGGFVAPGPQLASFVLNYTTLSGAWRKLATLAGSSTPYGWYVDENRALHFYDATTAISSGVTFTTAPTTSGSTTEGHILLDSQNGYEWDGTSIRNRILVQGANQTITHGSVTSTSPTNTWRGDGATISWPLRYTVTGSPVLKINGVTTSVTVVQAGATGTVSGAWLVQQNTSGQWFLTASTAPANGVSIQIWYDYQIPIVAVANDVASQAEYTGPNGGVFEEYIYDTTLTTPPMALSRAQRERTEYAFAAERVTFNTSEDFLGWVRAGQTCTVNNQLAWNTQSSSWGVNDTFIVVGNMVTFGSGGYRQCQITSVRL